MLLLVNLLFKVPLVLFLLQLSKLVLAESSYLRLVGLSATNEVAITVPKRSAAAAALAESGHEVLTGAVYLLASERRFHLN
jgi:hypothetical protein